MSDFYMHVLLVEDDLVLADGIARGIHSFLASGEANSNL